jgi:nitrite reductase/ring-hydroxylating ferredoxin subunit/DMSO/TMAO reductase YedYZ heme-binding membrane subunit
MSVSYVAIGWNRQKRIYDTLLLSFVAVYLLLFIGLSLIFYPEVTQETLIIRSTSTLAVIMLHVILAIGPLARLNTKFLPLLYNRRHLGVTMFCIAAVHGVFSILQFHSLGNINPIVSVFTANKHYESLTRFPFQSLGFCALLIFFLMAITSHDFWLHNLTPRIWKTLHMLVYAAYVLVIVHVVTGALQYEHAGAYSLFVCIGAATIISLHLVAGLKEYRMDAKIATALADGFVEVCNVNEIKESRAKMVCTSGERIAVFKYEGKLSAVNNVCRHQNGPLGEGKIVDGCITCPWHGYQYLPHNGQSPPPFKERVETYDVKLIGTTVYVNPKGYPEGTFVEPLKINV